MVDSVSMGHTESESIGCFGTPGEFSQGIKKNGHHENLIFFYILMNIHSIETNLKSKAMFSQAIQQK